MAVRDDWRPLPGVREVFRGTHYTKNTQYGKVAPEVPYGFTRPRPQQASAQRLVQWHRALNRREPDPSLAGRVVGRRLEPHLDRVGEPLGAERAEAEGAAGGGTLQHIPGRSSLLESSLPRASWTTLFLTHGRSVSHARSLAKREAAWNREIYLAV